MYEIRRSSSFGSSLVEIVLFLALLGAFLTCMAVFFVCRCFVKYPQQRKKLWIALACCIGCALASGLLYKATGFESSPSLAGIGIAVLLITCLVVELKNRDTLMRENVNLIDEVLRKPWEWGSETPLPETEQEQLAA